MDIRVHDQDLHRRLPTGEEPHGRADDAGQAHQVARIAPLRRERRPEVLEVELRTGRRAGNRVVGAAGPEGGAESENGEDRGALRSAEAGHESLP